MLFNSYIFLLCFFPIIVLAYFIMNRFQKKEWGKVVIILGSFVFIAYSSVYHALVLLGSIIINWIINKQLNQTDKNLSRKEYLVLGIVANVVGLIAFKYCNFIIQNLNLVLGKNFNYFHIILPLGISFYTFQQITYLVDNYWGNVPKEYSALDYLAFVAFFPKLLEGPVVYHDELIPQLRDEKKKKLDLDNISRGLFIFAIGLTKKVLVADNFGKIVDFGYTNVVSLNSFEALITIVGYTLQIYFDFSGYCDMAIGVAKMLNIDLPWNFESPYKAKDINEFWRKWHITLTRFLTKYIYIPLGGNRKGMMRTYLNIIIVFLVSGLWHGVGYTFLFWGLLHGLASILYRIFKKPYDHIPAFFRWIFTFIFINFTWVFFRASTVSDAVALFRQLFVGGWKFFINAELMEIMLQPTFVSVFSRLFPFNVVILVVYVIALFVVMFLNNSREMLINYRPNIKTFIFTYTLLMLSILSVSGVSTFLYVNF